MSNSAHIIKLRCKVRGYELEIETSDIAEGVRRLENAARVISSMGKAPPSRPPSLDFDRFASAARDAMASNGGAHAFVTTDLHLGVEDAVVRHQISGNE